MADSQPECTNINELVPEETKKYAIEYVDRKGNNGVTVLANEIFVQDPKSNQIARGTDAMIEKYFRNPMNQHSLRIRQPDKSNEEKGGYERIRVTRCLDLQGNEKANVNTSERARRIPKKKPVEESPVIKYSPAPITGNNRTAGNYEEELSRSGSRKKCLQKNKEILKALKEMSNLTQKKLNNDFAEILPINEENRRVVQLQRQLILEERSQDDNGTEEEPKSHRKWKKILRIVSSSDDDDDNNGDNSTDEATAIPVCYGTKSDDIVNEREQRESSVEGQIINEANRGLNHLNETVSSTHDDRYSSQKHNSIPVDFEITTDDEINPLEGRESSVKAIGSGEVNDGSNCVNDVDASNGGDGYAFKKYNCEVEKQGNHQPHEQNQENVVGSAIPVDSSRKNEGCPVEFERGEDGNNRTREVQLDAESTTVDGRNPEPSDGHTSHGSIYGDEACRQSSVKISVDETSFEDHKVHKTGLEFAVKSQKAVEDNDEHNDWNSCCEGMCEKGISMETLDDVHVVMPTNEVRNVTNERIPVDLEEPKELTNGNRRITYTSAVETTVGDECGNVESNDIEAQLQRIHGDNATVAPRKKPTVVETKIFRKGESVFTISQKQHAATNSCTTNKKEPVIAYETPIRKAGSRSYKLEFTTAPSRDPVGKECDVNQNKKNLLRRETRQVATPRKGSSSDEEETESGGNVITTLRQVLQALTGSEGWMNNNYRPPRGKQTETKKKIGNKECDGKRDFSRKEIAQEIDLYDFIDDDKETHNSFAPTPYEKSTVDKKIVQKVESKEGKAHHRKFFPKVKMKVRGYFGGASLEYFGMDKRDTSMGTPCADVRIIQQCRLARKMCGNMLKVMYCKYVYAQEKDFYGGFDPGEGTSKSCALTSCGNTTDHKEVGHREVPMETRNTEKTIFVKKNKVRRTDNTGKNGRALKSSKTPTGGAESDSESRDEEEDDECYGNRTCTRDKNLRKVEELIRVTMNTRKTLKSMQKDMIAERKKQRKAPHVEPLVDLTTVRNNENVELVRGIVFKQTALIKACGAVNLRRRLNSLIDNYWTAEEQKKLVLSNNAMTKRRGQRKIPEEIIKGLIDVCFTLQQTKEIPTDGFTSYEDGRKFLAAKLKGNRFNEKRKGYHHLKNQQQGEEPNGADENLTSDDDSASE